MLTVVEQAGAAGAQQGDRLVGTALALADGGQEPECRVAIEASATPREVGTPVFGPGSDQRGGLLVAAGGARDLDQDAEGQFAYVPTQQGERLLRAAVPHQQARVGLQCHRVSGLHADPGDLDRLVDAAPALQQRGRGCDGRPPAGRQVRAEHLQRVDLPALLTQQPRPRQRAEPLPASGVQLHHVDVAAFEQPRDQLRRDAPGPRPGPVFKISSVHGHAP